MLAHGAAAVIAIERDPRCLGALREIGDRYPGRLTVIEQDALLVDLATLPVLAGTPFRIVANLPYNVGTALLAQWIGGAAWPPGFDRLVLMFQKEVAERIVATPDQRAAYGRLAVLCGWRSEAKILFDVPPSAFVPPPKITSSVVELVTRLDPLQCDPATLSAMTLAAFGQRRKMLRQSLRSLPLRNGRAVDVVALLDEAAIVGTKRAEDVDIPGFVALAQSWDRLVA